MMTKALIAMSGGVDSSLAALLTMREGFECIGCTMKLHDNRVDSDSMQDGVCYISDDVEDARSVAERLGIPFHVFDFRDDFRCEVISRFVDMYERGMTPNPCIDCNRHMKFDRLLQCAGKLGCDYIVSGHYARVDMKDGRYRLRKSADESKDQSYVLYMLTQEQLAHVRFPLGEYNKSDVRQMAHDNGFITADKPDSQDICFVPDGDYAAFIERFTGHRYSSGDFVDTEGNVLGEHKGTIRYTVGQRKGLGIAVGRPMYVKRIDTESNRVILCDDEELFSDTLWASEFNWVSIDKPMTEIRCKAKIRYRHREQDARAFVEPDGLVRVVFDCPQRAVTPGQAVVLYDGDTVLGGGRIRDGREKVL